jgi:hypothetical protein
MDSVDAPGSAALSSADIISPSIDNVIKATICLIRKYYPLRFNVQHQRAALIFFDGKT